MTNMKFLHREFDGGPNNVVSVSLSSQANVLLMDEPNFRNYQAGRSYRYFGGHAERSPVRLVPPRQGRWHVVVDLGGYAGSVRANVSIA
jgi:hypothetical protein